MADRRDDRISQLILVRYTDPFLGEICVPSTIKQPSTLYVSMKPAHRREITLWTSVLSTHNLKPSTERRPNVGICIGH